MLYALAFWVKWPNWRKSWRVVPSCASLLSCSSPGLRPICVIACCLILLAGAPAPLKYPAQELRLFFNAVVALQHRRQGAMFQANGRMVVRERICAQNLLISITAGGYTGGR